MRLLFMLSLLWFSCIATANEPSLLTGLRIQPSATSTRFTFILTTKTYGHVQYLPNPHRLIVDLANTRQQVTINNLHLVGSNVQSIQLQKKVGGVRFVFYLQNKVKWTIRFLPMNHLGGVYLQLDVISTDATSSPPLRQPKPSGMLPFSFKKGLKKEMANSVTKQAIKTSTFFTIVIDAGHGGRDSGAKGRSGTMEKTVVLSIAKKLADEINHSATMRAILTRKGDYFIPLAQRLQFARKGKADLFVAIHADAYFNNTATGASIYALSDRGATSVAARWLAMRENHSELNGVALNALQDQSLQLRSVLIDLAQTRTMQDSARLGVLMLDALEKITPLHYTRVERAPFLVLKSPDIPSVLVETGFISNAREEKRLASDVYQAAIAHALFEGINAYVTKM